VKEGRARRERPGSCPRTRTGRIDVPAISGYGPFGLERNGPPVPVGAVGSRRAKGLPARGRGPKKRSPIRAAFA
jgi:hypothetical protein